MKNWISNKQQLAITPQRQLVLDIAEAGLSAIDTENVVREKIKLAGNNLTVDGKSFNLANFKRVFILGFGKASGKAALALENILGDFITDGVVISLKTVSTKRIRSFSGTHPLPSLANVHAAHQMAAMIKHVSADDLVLCLVSGGGSALLCWHKDECDQGIKLYNSYLKTGDDIKSLNTVRKHISAVKGGGLAKMLYPATVVSLIFSDVAGNNAHFVDSGPTFSDSSTAADAQKIIDKYQLGNFVLNETPKEQKYFEKVHNIVLVSNQTALQAMKTMAEHLGHKAVIVSAELLEPPAPTLEKLMTATAPGAIALAGSEIKLVVTRSGGRGGRNTYLAAYALDKISPSDTFAAVASDGLDNSDCAGVIVDAKTLEKIKADNLNIQDYLDRFDGLSLFEHTGQELIFTGPTEANVSDFLIFYKSPR